MKHEQCRLVYSTKRRQDWIDNAYVFVYRVLCFPSFLYFFFFPLEDQNCIHFTR